MEDIFEEVAVTYDPSRTITVSGFRHHGKLYIVVTSNITGLLDMQRYAAEDAARDGHQHFLTRVKRTLLEREKQHQSFLSSFKSKGA